MSLFHHLNAARRSRMAPFLPVEIGITEDAERITLGYDQLQRHVQLIGLSGRGKSRAIEYLLRQLLLNGVTARFVQNRTLSGPSAERSLNVA